MTDYEPEGWADFPHNKWGCPCGNSVVVIGWEFEAVKCGECSSLMEWREILHDPRGLE